MEERLLKFSRIVDAGSFTKAAKVLHISQPALTTAVKKLERELGTELLIRGSRGFTLTEPGKVVYRHAKALRDDIHNLKTQMAEQAGRPINLRLGLIDSVANLLFVHGSYLKELEQGTKLSLIVDNSARLIELVARDELDLALIAKPRQQQAALTMAAVGEEPLVFVAHAEQSALIRQELGQGRLCHFSCYNQASRTFELITEHFARFDIIIEPSFYSTSPEIMLELLLSGHSAAVLPYLLVKPHIEQGALEPINIGGSHIISRHVMAVYRKRTLPAHAQILLNNAVRALGDLQKQTQAAQGNIQ